MTIAKPPSPGIAVRLLVLVLITNLPAVGVALVNAIQTRQAALEEVRNNLRTLARLAADDLAGDIRDAGTLLSILSHMSVVAHAEEPACSTLLQQIASRTQIQATLFVVDAQGQRRCGNLPVSANISYADRDYFQEALKSRELSIGSPVIGRVSKKPVLSIAYPTLDAAGQVQSVIITGLDLEWFAGNLIRGWGRHTEIVLSLWDPEGRVLYRYPDNEKWASTRRLEAPIAQAVLAGKGLRTVEATGLDGVLRVYTLTDIPGERAAGLTLSMGVPRSQLFETANQKLVRTLLLLFLVAGTGLVAAWWLVQNAVRQPVRRLVEASAQLGARDRNIRLAEPFPAGELGWLMAAFNQTAASLQDQRHEIERQQADLIALNADLERRVAARTHALEEVNKELEEFSYSVSHDLRAPLRHIQGYVEMLLEETEGQLSAEAQRYLQIIAAASGEMGELIDKLLEFSRLGRAEMQAISIALDALVQEVLAELEMVTRERHIVWHIAPLPAVIGDPVLLKQVFVNLVGNAVKYSRLRDPAEITVGCAGKEGGRIILFVRDNGVGFDMQYAGKLFGVFQRLHRADEFEGTGIGLANVRRVVARHNGRVWAEAAPNQGATFYFTLQPAVSESTV